MQRPNYIPDINRFNLAGPPTFWLNQLREFDDSLVLIPSRTGFFYRLAQRRPMADFRMDIVNDIMKEDADTRMLYRHGLVPVTTVLATADWTNPAMFTELARRAPHRNGGADAFEKKLIAQERQDQLDQAIAQNEKNEYLAKDSWRYYNKLVGLRSNVYSPKTPNNRPEVRTGIRRVSPDKPRYRPDVQTNFGGDKRFFTK